MNLVFFKVSYPRRSENAYFLVVWTLKVLKDNLPFFWQVNIKKVTGGAWSSCSWVRLGPCRHFDKKFQKFPPFCPKKWREKNER
jgi:hypothetical protein